MNEDDATALQLHTDEIQLDEMVSNNQVTSSVYRLAEIVVLFVVVAVAVVVIVSVFQDASIDISIYLAISYLHDRVFASLIDNDLFAYVANITYLNFVIFFDQYFVCLADLIVSFIQLEEWAMQTNHLISSFSVVPI